ncbi:protein phosphatase 2C 53-like [Impatiens glandulifera]|uniref:protein phosphatase 2C 53-like n=1 Tax=Impatiens glandulifera TaxID=253017 RepID=UPI001FB056BB|nr:protein phosphatase 2C 53-like [Impatiens glandulifera]
MEEMSTAISVPSFMLSNLIYDDSVLLANQMEIRGLELIVKTANLFSDPIPLTGCENNDDDASLVKMMIVEETREEEIEANFERNEKKAEIAQLIDCRKPRKLSLWGFSSICGKRSEMEDTVAVLPGFLKFPKMLPTNETTTGHFFGVYDGHGGFQVANYCRDRFHVALAEEMEISWKNGCVDWEQQWEKTFFNCFVKVNAEVVPIAPDAVGSTAVVAVVSSSHIIVANCGDSRAVLYRGREAVPLSVDHKPNREDERARIEAAGGKVIDWNGYRVSAVLGMSRSIGDRYLDPYVIPDPEIKFVKRTKEDECLILASDGLWDVISNEEACQAARKRILLWHKKNGDAAKLEGVGEEGERADPAAEDAADYLSRLALHRGSNDNISVIVLDLKAHRKLKKKTST